MAITYKREDGIDLVKTVAFMINEKMFKSSALWEDMALLPNTPVSVHGSYIRCTAFYGADLVAVATINSPQGWYDKANSTMGYYSYTIPLYMGSTYDRDSYEAIL